MHEQKTINGDLRLMELAKKQRTNINRTSRDRKLRKKQRTNINGTNGGSKLSGADLGHNRKLTATEPVKTEMLQDPDRTHN